VRDEWRESAPERARARARAKAGERERERDRERERERERENTNTKKQGHPAAFGVASPALRTKLWLAYKAQYSPCCLCHLNLRTSIQI